MDLSFIPGKIVAPFEEVLDGSPFVRRGQHGQEAVRHLRCNWNVAYDLMFEILGGTGYNISSNTLTLHGPHSLPMPYLWPFVAVECSFKGHAPKDPPDINPYGEPTTGNATYHQAEIEVVYRPTPISRDELDAVALVVEEDMDFSAEFVTLPQQKLFWDAASTMAMGSGESKAVIETGAEWRYTYKSFPGVPVIFMNLMGKTNTSSVSSYKYSLVFAAETLLYLCPEVEPFTDGLGRQMNRITLRMSYKPTGWNKAWRAGNAVPQPIYAGGSLYKPYAPADFDVVLLT